MQWVKQRQKFQKKNPNFFKKVDACPAMQGMLWVFGSRFETA
jgi:hypothetical protein